MLKFTQKSVTGKVYKTIIQHGLFNVGDKVVVALSGGADSVSLLMVLLELKKKMNVQVLACHYNHRLRGQESDADENFVRKLCADYEIPLIVGGAGESSKLKSEEKAREARYQFFEKILQEGRGDWIAIAHNLNDQAETVLMRLIRGTGIRGLKSIPYKRKNFIRPLLDIPRKDLEKYLADLRVKYVIDKTNLLPDYTRNDIRLSLIPYLSKLNPNILETLANFSKNANLDYAFIEESARKELKRLTLQKDAGEVVLSYGGWLALDPSLRAMTIRLALSSISTLDDITSTQLDEVVVLLEKGVGKKHKSLPHSLRIELTSGKIILSRINI